MARIYVSSTYSDLKDEREQVRLSLRRLGHEDVAMEYYVAGSQRPIDKCLQDVAASDLYIGVFAFRYGYIPHGYTKSITELEYRKAVELGKACIILLLEEDALWPISKVELSAIDKIKKFHEELKERHVVSFFTDKDNIEARVTQAVREWEKTLGIEGNNYVDWEAYTQAVVDLHRWVRLSVIAGARKDSTIQIPLTEVFVPQECRIGHPIHEIPEEDLYYKRRLYSTHKSANSSFSSRDQSHDKTPSVTGSAIPESVLSVFAREKHQVILGGPGSGKSTLLLYMMLSLCTLEHTHEALPPQLQELPTPFLVELRQYALSAEPDFVKYISANVKERYGLSLDVKGLSKLLEEDGKALVLFDGLDEIFDPGMRSNTIQRFKSFVRKYPQIHVIVTSRIAGYEPTDLGVSGFSHYTLLDFKLSQIRTFIPRWYEYYTWERNIRDAQSLIGRIADSPRLLELAGNPLLLTMMAVIYQRQDLPEERWKLYERCTEVLLEDWDIKRKSIDYKSFLPLDIHIRTPQKSEVLQRVSIYMLKPGRYGRELNAIAFEPLMQIIAEYLKSKYDKSQGDAEGIAADILMHLRERTFILAEIGERIFGFVHRTFMEYFAALHCKAEFNSRRADYSWLNEELFKKNWNQDEWQEVLLLLIAMLADQGSPIQEVVEYLQVSQKHDWPSNIVFAARCLAEANRIENQEQAQNLVTELIKAITKNSSKSEGILQLRFTRAALKAFSSLAPLIEIPPASKKSISRLEKSKSLEKRMIGWQMGLALRSRNERLEFALSALQDKEEAVRRGAIAALEREWPGREDISQALLTIVNTDSVPGVRQAALQALHDSWPVSNEVLNAIEAESQRETPHEYSAWLFENLSRNWQGNVQALKVALTFAGLLREAYYKDLIEYKSIYEYQNITSSITQGWKNHPDTLPFLLASLKDDKTSNNVRAVIIGVIASGWTDNNLILEVTHWARSSEDVRIRRAALYSQLKQWPSNPETTSLLHNRALNDPDVGIRWIALVLSVGHLIEESDLDSHTQKYSLYELAFLLESAMKKGHRSTRTNEPQHSDLLTLLHKKATGDSDSRIRVLALRTLIRGWSGHQQLISLLFDRAKKEPDPEIRRMAIQNITESLHDHPDTLPLLQERALNDSDDLIRETSKGLYAAFMQAIRLNHGL